MTTVNVIGKENSDLCRAAMLGPVVSAPCPRSLGPSPTQPSLSLTVRAEETQAQRGCCCPGSHSWEVAEQGLGRWPASLPPTSDLGAPGGQSPNPLTSG